MGNVNKPKDIILILDHYDAEARNLHESLKSVKCQCPTIVVYDDGYVPDDVVSLFGYFLGDYKTAEDYLGRPRYFNEVKVPELWEIKSDYYQGEVYDKIRKKADIIYEKGNLERNVKEVIWLSESGKKLVSEHYNNLGVMYARTTYDRDEKAIIKSYFNAKKQEVIVEHLDSGRIVLNEEDGEVRVLAGRVELALYLMILAEYKDSRIFFNSLGIPFQISLRLWKEQTGDILFWQEPPREDIPGNMQFILEGKAPRVEAIMVQRKDSYHKLVNVGVDKTRVLPFGYIYQYVRAHSYGKNALICTNSDEIEMLSELVQAFSDIHFHIMAVTEMSQKLWAFERYDNVSLYPNCSNRDREKLFELCDIYLDINQGKEIVNAVEHAFLNNMLIMGWIETRHNKRYVAKKHYFEKKDVKQFIEKMRLVVDSNIARDEFLLEQKRYALGEESALYEALKDGKRIGRA